MATTAQQRLIMRARPLSTVPESVRIALVAFVLSRLIVAAALGLTSSWPAYVLGWDTEYYARIADVGYGQSGGGVPLQAFSPLLPLLERLLAPLGGSPEVAGFLIASGCSLAALALLHAMTAERFGRPAAHLAVLTLAFFPFSAVLSTGYTEGPYLLLTLAAFRAWSSERALPAAACSMLAALCRPTGVLLAPAFAIAALRGGRNRRVGVAAAAGAVVGWAAFALHLALVTGDPLASIHAQGAWHRHVSLLAGPGQVLLLAVHGIAALDLRGIVYSAAIPAALFGLLRLRRCGADDAALLFAWGSFLLPLFTGSQMSLPRFLMGCFPFAWAAGLLLARAPRRVRVVALAAEMVALALVTYACYGVGSLAP